jgi:coproporphyrinogen III oxidase
MAENMAENTIGNTAVDYPLDAQQQAAQTWFAALRDRICAAFEAIEDDAATVPVLPNAPTGPGRFQRTAWVRTDADDVPNGGGGVMSVMKGRVFEKVGVNISTVHGQFAPEFARQMNGAADDPRFFATGISLVAHMANPHVPAVHMNTRMLVTTKRWFGGGADLNPALPIAADTAAFKAELQKACDAHGPESYANFARWADDYFWVPHRKRHRGVGGIFYDHLETGFDHDFALVRATGEAFLNAFPAIVRQRMATPWSDAERDTLLRYRGLYAEFNLVHDRGTIFGLKTGGNIDAILMSLPPEARWG